MEYSKFDLWFLSVSLLIMIVGSVLIYFSSPIDNEQITLTKNNCCSGNYCSDTYFDNNTNECVYTLSGKRDKVVLVDKNLTNEELFLIIADRFTDNHVYSEDYNCNEFSFDLMLLSQHLGFNVSCMLLNNHVYNLVCFEGVCKAFEPQNASYVDSYYLNGVPKGKLIKVGDKK